jgi:aryl-alcohol dehydrogenase-like predicted oxidoreductase
MGVLSYSSSPAAGSPAATARTPATAPPDPCPSPGSGWPTASTSHYRRTSASFEAADRLAQLTDETGLTLIELAIAFVLRHPGVTSAIIGPRTMEHLDSQLTAADTVLTDDALDKIDEIVPPGLTLNPADNGWSTRTWYQPPAAGKCDECAESGVRE